MKISDPLVSFPKHPDELTWYTPPSKAASKKEGDDSVTGGEVSNAK